MELRTVGRSGLQVSVLGLGCNNFGPHIDEDAARAVVWASVDAGVTFFDTSDSYGGGRSEEYLGRALAGHRDEVVVATKFASRVGDGPYDAGASRKHCIAACEASLRRLGTDYIDLYYQHFPDPKTPVEETLETLDTLVRAGKVRYVANSNFAGWQVVEAEYVARVRGTTRFIANQYRWSLLERGIEIGVVPACAAYDVAVVPFFPLASGLLTGKYERGKPPPEGTRLASSPRFQQAATDAAFDTLDRLSVIGEKAGRSLLELAIGWLAAQPVVPSVLVGATKPEQAVANAAAAQVTLSAEEVAAVSEATSGAVAVAG
ncbi:MAG TPA: aldo/keto reductase [Acidimicrobiales bacterium]|nr:aldo/keto reductase [Acidimicrobiales bacterium]